MADARSTPGPALVAAAAILLDDRSAPGGRRVLACRRTWPAETAGRWEFPGGKVEPGERPEDALIREVGEELGCLVEVGDWLDARTAIRDGLELRVATAIITAGEARPREGEHDRIRWLSADELDEVDWLEPDRPAVAEIREMLAPTPARTRLIVFEADDAEAAADRLRFDGWEAEITRERYQGEDDDEDHPWAVSTDAPTLVVDLLPDAFDGWLDEPEDGDAPTAEPVQLPDGPKRIKRPEEQDPG